MVDSLGDCMAFGALKPCEECQGQLVFKSDAYYCTGDLSAWTKCVFKTQLPNRKDWVIPKVAPFFGFRVSVEFEVHIRCCYSLFMIYA